LYENKESKHTGENFASKTQQNSPALAGRILLPEPISETTYLQVPTARITARGYLLPYAVDFAIQGLIDRGDWPFQYEYVFYSRPTGKHLRALTPNSVITISQLQYGDVQPRKADFRKNLRLSNQTLFNSKKRH